MLGESVRRLRISPRVMKRFDAEARPIIFLPPLPGIRKNARMTTQVEVERPTSIGDIQWCFWTDSLILAFGSPALILLASNILAALFPAAAQGCQSALHAGWLRLGLTIAAFKSVYALKNSVRPEKFLLPGHPKYGFMRLHLRHLCLTHER
jgi:hypothetical protein